MAGKARLYSDAVAIMETSSTPPPANLYPGLITTVNPTIARSRWYRILHTIVAAAWCTGILERIRHREDVDPGSAVATDVLEQSIASFMEQASNCTQSMLGIMFWIEMFLLVLCLATGVSDYVIK